MTCNKFNNRQTLSIRRNVQGGLIIVCLLRFVNELIKATFGQQYQVISVQNLLLCLKSSWLSKQKWKQCDKLATFVEFLHLFDKVITHLTQVVIFIRSDFLVILGDINYC